MNSELMSNITFFHILISFATFCVLGLAAFTALLLHLEHHLLHNRPLTQMIRFFPPLQTLEGFFFWMVRLGFILLSCSLVSAFFFMTGDYRESQIHKILFSILAWLLFAILLYGRHHSGWRGPTAVRWTLYGTIALLVAYFSSKLIVFN